MPRALFFSSLSPSHPPRPPPQLSLSPNLPHSPLPISFPLSHSSSSSSSSNDSPHTEKPWLSSDAVVKVPTAPWMRGPFLLPADQVLDLSRPKPRKKKGEDGERWDRALTDRVRGGRGRQAMRHIVSSITKLREIQSPGSDDNTKEVSDDESSDSGRRGVRVPWARAEKKLVFRREKKERVPTVAELTLPEAVLTRLRAEARGMTEWVKAKKAGVTEEVVDGVRRAWRKEELAMVKVVEPLCRNMDRAREIIEAKTGGLVVWVKKDTLVVYRGSEFPLIAKTFQDSTFAVSGESSLSELVPKDTIVIFPEKSYGQAQYSHPAGMDFETENVVESVNGTLYEREANRLLDGLGPRFVDWWWRKPLPVDADLLPEVVPGFKSPFRLLPPQVSQKLTDDELTYLRKLARPLPTHFALGKNSKLQGLADAIIKLWEKSIIAKVAVKVGIQNTNHKQMSWELKRLTGGTLILSNKFFIILYRGKDFLSDRVASSILERQTVLCNQQLQEEEARSNAIQSLHYIIDELGSNSSTVGTFAEFQDLQENYAPLSKGNSEIKVQIEAEKRNLEKELREQERKLLILNLKIEKSEKELAKLNWSRGNSVQVADQELLTEEERETLRKIGLKMDEFLLLGRRGVYNGVIGSIHQHWKFREVVKVITMQNSIQLITYTARLLEIESGGILVAVEKLSKGHAIVLYRGKNYTRPLTPLPENLLTKRRALQRSIEVQRRGSLKYFAHNRQREIRALKQKLRLVEQRANELSSGESQNYTAASFSKYNIYI